MMRRTPLLGSRFPRRIDIGGAARLPRDERLAAAAARLMAQASPRAATMAPPVVTVEPIKKHEYVRSKALREAYRLIPCQHCGRDDGTVCCAHANWGFGKGGAIKADDNRGASLCSTCHVPLLDQGSKLSKAERQAMWWSAHCKTVELLLARGLWPADVPVPDISAAPWS